MHLLAAQPGLVSDGTEPIDPNQSPADVVILSAADTELAALSSANAALGGQPDFLRLAQLSWLAHPYSVDLYLEKTASKAKLVIVRALGGLPYWQYAIEQFAHRLHEENVAFAALPGDDKPDRELASISTVPKEIWELLLAYCVEGGAANFQRLLRLCRHMLYDEARPERPTPLLRAGYYWPGIETPSIWELRRQWNDSWPVAAIIFYRALLQSGNLEPVDQLTRALQSRSINPMPLFVASLKDPLSAATVERAFESVSPSIIMNTTGFALNPAGTSSSDWNGTILDSPGRPVIQIVLASCSEELWREGSVGLPARDIAMNVSLPEVDGRIFGQSIAFKAQSYRDETTQCPVAGHRSKSDRVNFAADLAANWIRLGAARPENRKIGIVLANYPNRDGRLANGVGLDTPASVATALSSLQASGYRIGSAPTSGDDLMQALLSGPTNQLDGRSSKRFAAIIRLTTYMSNYEKLPLELRLKVEERWSGPEADPFFQDGAFSLSILKYGNMAIGIQPARGYNIDPKEHYHSPDLVPPHNYLAFYFWLRNEFGCHALVHFGKHGNLEWLPGKAVALSQCCFPEAAIGPAPNIYPFIVNDPGEGTQAKRRSQAVVIDHLTPPLTRAETYGALRELEVLVDEYYEAAGVDARRSEYLRDNIISTMSAAQIDSDAGIVPNDDTDNRLRKLDAFLCEIKESQIRDGLHIFGKAPEGRLERDLTSALLRLPRGDGIAGNASLTRALAADFKLGDSFDPLSCDMAEPWRGERPQSLVDVCDDVWRTVGDTVERLEQFACELIDGWEAPPGTNSEAVIAHAEAHVRPAVRACGASEIQGLLSALDGRFVPPGPSGAPTRGRIDILPTGRNFYSVDSRSLPTRTAWELGWKSASLLIERHVQDHGDWPRKIAVTAWGTSNMRTGGDDIAQVLALMGVRPVWDDANARVNGFEIIPLSALGRPRVDVTLRISGFFRDAFPSQTDLVASAARAVMELNEPGLQNPAAASYRIDSRELGDLQAGHRVFGSKPGAYGAGLQAMIDERLWTDRSQLGEIYTEWSGYAYGSGADGHSVSNAFATRLAEIEAVVQNQDNREHDVLDSDDYYQFEGGMSAAVENLRGRRPVVYHNDHSRPERPAIRTLEEEISRVVRSRAVNPKWIDGVKRHGYKGAFEMAATVDYLFAFAATTGAARTHHFDLVYNAYLGDESTRDFIAEHNRPALAEMTERFLEALERNLWQPKSNTARTVLAKLSAGHRPYNERRRENAARP